MGAGRGQTKRARAAGATPEERPMLITRDNGMKEWRRGGQFNGTLHRDDGPAVENTDGYQAWVREGQYHREDGPAIIHIAGTREWYQSGLRHREGGPAVERADGGREWWVRGELHRDDGPAIIHADGSVEYWLQGREVGPSEVKKIIKAGIERRVGAEAFEKLTF